jgi:predicted  nucleic acid-binding Zn-ribbon protein
MPHKCTKCGREYRDGSTEILKGCASCGGKKFLYVKEAEIHRDVLEEKSIGEIAQETKEEILEVRGGDVRPDRDDPDRGARNVRAQHREDGKG